MAKPKIVQTKEGKGAVALQGGISIITSLIETYGWSGTVVILSFAFVYAYASLEQKQAIIDMYILGKGIGACLCCSLIHAKALLSK